MGDVPTFPEFKRLGLEDRDVLHPRIWAFQSETSELTFNNFYLWRSHFRYEWTICDDLLLVMADEREGGAFGYPPIGAGPRADVAERFLHWMRDERGIETPLIARAGQRLADEIEGDDRFTVTETRDQFDYVYRTEDLAEYPGRKYSAKRNHVNQFTRYYRFEYQPITAELVPQCIELAEVWCEQRLCEDDLSLQHELAGILDVLNNYDALGMDGGALVIMGKVQALALGELLNESTAVMHIEKANPDFKGIYPTMTKTYAQRWQGEAAHISMEQDLGEPGLRRAKESYYPDFMSKKYEVRLAE